MTPNSFAEFFQKATQGRKPYPFQERFATSDQLPHLLRAPTGAGKTATAVLGWLWRWHSKIPNTPRRLIYCLPMRVLVEQSLREAKGWIKNLGLEKEVEVTCLMGGEETSENWYLNPEKPAILIGTQDMLLSRALNRGYAATRFHWPIDFGLLNNDALWIFDEPQLMASGVSTSAQLAGLREALRTFGPAPSIWMSATLEPSWLDTIDFKGKFPQPSLELDREKDYDPQLPLHTRMTAKKTLASLGLKVSKEADDKEMKHLAERVLKEHQEAGEDTQTLVIANTVRRAKVIYKAISDAIKKAKKDSPRLLLVHSRFRPVERRKLNEALQDRGEASKGRIIVATQVVEAGVDISSRTLITELAPWASIVQRIGRCNRTGDDGPGRVFWIDVDEKASKPYETDELAFAREHLQQIEKSEDQSVSPLALDEYKTKKEIVLPFEHKHILRRRDLLDLFDTSAELSGNDIDIARYVRSDDPDTDVQVFWRDLPTDGPTDREPLPHRDELCNVPIGDIKKFLDKGDKQAAYLWDYLDEKWQQLSDPKRELRTGMILMLPSKAGGYSRLLGWDESSTDVVEPILSNDQPPEATGSDPLSIGYGQPLTLAEHTQHVCDELDKILKDSVHLPKELLNLLYQVARWHDVGKAHEAFQYGLLKANPNLSSEKIWAKSGGNGRLRHKRKYFRHELASALAALAQKAPFLVAYLIATHHGKVRINIRTLPDEKPLPDKPDQLYALGVWDEDKLPIVDLGGGVTSSELILNLKPMQLGESSWTSQALQLLEEYGPFRLAYLEALIRAADLRASIKEREVSSHG